MRVNQLTVTPSMIITRSLLSSSSPSLSPISHLLLSYSLTCIPSSSQFKPCVHLASQVSIFPLSKDVTLHADLAVFALQMHEVTRTSNFLSLTLSLSLSLSCSLWPSHVTTRRLMSSLSCYFHRNCHLFYLQLLHLSYPVSLSSSPSISLNHSRMWVCFTHISPRVEDNLRNNEVKIGNNWSNSNFLNVPLQFVCPNPHSYYPIMCQLSAGEKEKERERQPVIQG